METFEIEPHYNFQLLNGDTDSIMFCKPDGAPFSIEERKELLADINSLLPELINFEDDGYYPNILIVKAKNYCLWDGKKLKIKGSALKGTYKERALSEFMEKFIRILMFSEGDKVTESQILYRSYVHEIFNLTDITRWSSKKTITESILNPERTNESRVADAIKDEDVSMGDKVYTYFKVDGSLSLQANWANDHDTKRLCEKLFKTIKIFESVVDIKLFPNYALKRNKALLEAIV
jgi:DNA polymerase elongation subunit (family B)